MDELPRSDGVLLEAITTEEMKVREWASTSIRKVETRRDDELRRLERARALFERTGPARANGTGQRSTATATTKARRRPNAKNAATPAAARKRREAVFRYLSEQDRRVAPVEIRKALGLSPFATQTALKGPLSANVT